MPRSAVPGTSWVLALGLRWSWRPPWAPARPGVTSICLSAGLRVQSGRRGCALGSASSRRAGPSRARTASRDPSPVGCRLTSCFLCLRRHRGPRGETEARRAAGGGLQLLLTGRPVRREMRVSWLPGETRSKLADLRRPTPHARPPASSRGRRACTLRTLTDCQLAQALGAPFVCILRKAGPRPAGAQPAWVDDRAV